MKTSLLTQSGDHTMRVYSIPIIDIMKESGLTAKGLTFADGLWYDPITDCMRIVVGTDEEKVPYE